MPSAMNRRKKIVRAREVDRLNDIRRASAAGDERRVAIECTIPEAPRLVVTLIPCQKEPAAQTRAQLFHVGLG